MKKLLLVLIVLMFAGNAFVFAEGDIGNIKFEIALPPSIDQDIFITLRNNDLKETYDLAFLNANDYKLEMELSYGNYQVINVKMEDADKYTINYGDIFEISPKGFTLGLHIREKKAPVVENKPVEYPDIEVEVIKDKENIFKNLGVTKVRDLFKWVILVVLIIIAVIRLYILIRDH